MQEQEPMTPELAVMVLKNQTEVPPGPQLVAEAVTALAQLVDQNVPERVDLPDDDGYPACWHFVGYQPGGDRTANVLNPPNAPQYQGVVFADGTVVMRWLTARRSWSVWESFEEMFDVHGHPEYGTQIVWPSGDAPQEALDVINAAMERLAEKRAAEAEAERVRQLPETPSPAEEAVRRDREQRLGAVASSPNGWTVHSLAELTEEQAAEILDQPGAQGSR